MLYPCFCPPFVCSSYLVCVSTFLMNYFDVRLPYFYHMPVAVLLGIYIAGKIEGLGSIPDNDPMIVIRTVFMILPAATGAVYFFRQFKARNDLHLRESVFILGMIQFLTYLLPSFLR